MNGGDPRPRRGVPPWLIPAVVALAVVAVVVVVVVAPPGRQEQGTDQPLTIEPFVAGTEVPSAEVLPEVVAALERLLGARQVTIEGVAYSVGERIGVEATVDLDAAALRFRETLSPGVQVNGPAGADAIVAETVLIGDDAWVRVLQPGQSADTPYQAIDFTGLSQATIDGVYTLRGRFLDSLPQLLALLSEVPVETERLEARSLEGSDADRVRVTMRTPDVMAFLRENGLATVGESEVPGATRFEFWYDESGLRALVVTGVHFFDGEALDTSAWVVYRRESSVVVNPPELTVGN